MLLMQYVMGMIIVGSSTIVIVEALRLFVSIVKSIKNYKWCWESSGFTMALIAGMACSVAFLIIAIINNIIV